MYILHKLSDTQSILMYHSVVKLSFKVAYILPQKSSDMLNKITLDAKKVLGQSEAACKQAGAIKSFDVYVGGEVTKPIVKNML